MHGFKYRFGTGADLQFSVDVFDVRADRVHGNRGLLGQFQVGKALGESREYVHFASCESNAHIALGGVRLHAVQHVPRDRRAHRRTTGKQAHYRLADTLIRFIFQQVTGGARFDGRQHAAFCAKHRDHHALAGRILLFDFTDQGDAVAIGQGEIGQQHLRHKACESCASRREVRTTRSHIERRMAADGFCQVLPCCLLVFDEQYTVAYIAFGWCCCCHFKSRRSHRSKSPFARVTPREAHRRYRTLGICDHTAWTQNEQKGGRMNQYRIARKGAYHRAKRATGVAMLASLLALLAACSGDGTVAAPPVSGPLPGSGTALARDAITTVDVGDTYTPAEISIGPNGEEIIRTKLEIVFRPQATVAEVNELLNAINASITTSIAGLEGLVVRIPDPLTLAALDTIVADIESRPFVWFVRRALMPEREVLPTNIQPTAENAIHIRHHLAVGAQGAWNARAAATTAPHVLVVDRFGDGPPDNALNYTYAGNAANDFATGNTNAHGYHVAGIIGGAFGGPDTDRGYVTGMLPRTMQLSAVDMKKIDPLDAEKHLFQRVQSIGAGTVIVNTSFGYGCNTFVTCLAIEEIREQAAWWLIQVRTLGLEGRFLHLKSAGNVQPPFFVDEARYNMYAGAALFADLVDSAGAPLAPLTNLLAVENAWPTQEFPYASSPQWPPV